MTAWMHNAFGNNRRRAYNGHDEEGAREPTRGGKMRRTLTTVRCVPRFGYEHAQVRTVDLDLLDVANEREVLAALRAWFTQRGIPDAVYDVAVDDDGFFGVINDEAYHENWGQPVL
ncbi:MAG: hypothetical protein ACE5I3_00370 [Phycisphaerae bacterium]